MRFPRMIRSLLETDLYKFSMGQAIFHQFSDYTTKWRFKCRNAGVVFTQDMVEEIREQIGAYCELRFTEDELAYLGKIPWISRSYINFLRLWHPRYRDIFIDWTEDGCGLDIWVEGSWLNTSFYEIPILAIVNETYFRMKYDYDVLIDNFKTRAYSKLDGLRYDVYRLGVFSEFGERRRLSSEAQEFIIGLLAKGHNGSSRFIGTSNVYLAREFGVVPVGTMAHEFIQCVGQGNHKHNPAYSNHYMMKAWVQEYETQNGTALTDCIGTDVFLRDFNLTYATLFSGVRHDSGDPIEWGEKILAHYNKLGIDTSTKTLLFSDSLDFQRATKIFDHFNGRTKVAFGIGTFLANDCGVEPLNIVCKVVECNGNPVAKISDTPGKGLCQDSNYINYLKKTIAWRLEKTTD